MTVRLIVLIPLLAAVVAAAFWWRFVLCERDCEAMDRQSRDLFQRGELLPALALLDKVDGRCNCGRFTSGDAPPQYALAQVSIPQLRSEGRSVEVHDLLAHARGHILKELAVRLANDQPAKLSTTFRPGDDDGE